MTVPVRSIPCHDADDREPLLTREWLITNGLGGYASGTVSGVLTRRYHALLVAALPAPFGRTVMLNRISERILLPNGAAAALDCTERPDSGLDLRGCTFLREFRLDCGLPVWRYGIDGWIVERRLLMPYTQNTVHVHYALIEGEGALRIELYPGLHFRVHDAPVSQATGEPYTLTITGPNCEISAGPAMPSLRLKPYGNASTLILDEGRALDLVYRVEQRRGYEYFGRLWCPGFYQIELSRESGAALVASTEPWDTVLALRPDEALAAERRRRSLLLSAADPKAQMGVAAELVLAADQFLISPAGRTEDRARARAAGDEVRTIIAGYHWFTDWGRDTMISLDGLTLATGRCAEAGWILRTFAHYIRDGLIPNMFPEGGNEGLYHTADATLWFFHALDRYLRTTDDRATLGLLLDKLLAIIDSHSRGTRFGIRVDPADGLLSQGEQGYQLTWMDAKVDDWVVTPRRGKAVEINALWYNALRLLEGWLRQQQGEDAARHLGSQADRVWKSFNERFWFAAGGYLYDVVDGETGDDSACRPNQVLAISLAHPVLERGRWEPVLETVRRRLLTPVGLRSLAPGERDYKATYDGDLRARDAAYHQGTVWGWLIGPFVDAWLKVHPGDSAAVRGFLEGFVPHLNEACVGSMSEIFDAEHPFTPRGCIAQAWTVAEVLRSLVRTSPPP